MVLVPPSEQPEDDPKKRRIPIFPGFPELERSDVSIYPAYSKLCLAYLVVCRHRYHWAKEAQRKQFMRELHSFEKIQSNALDGVRVHREFSQGILSHTIPPRRYIQKMTPDMLKSKQRMRVEEIISGFDTKYHTVDCSEASTLLRNVNPLLTEAFSVAGGVNKIK